MYHRIAAGRTTVPARYRLNFVRRPQKAKAAAAAAAAPSQSATSSSGGADKDEPPTTGATGTSSDCVGRWLAEIGYSRVWHEYSTEQHDARSASPSVTGHQSPRGVGVTGLERISIRSTSIGGGKVFFYQQTEWFYTIFAPAAWLFLMSTSTYRGKYSDEFPKLSPKSFRQLKNIYYVVNCRLRHSFKIRLLYK